MQVSPDPINNDIESELNGSELNDIEFELTLAVTPLTDPLENFRDIDY